MSMSEEIQKLKSWLKNIFEKDGFNILEFDFPNYDTTGGNSADIIFVSITAHNERNQNEQVFEIIVKKNKQNDLVLNESDLKLVYSTEINLYSEIVPYYQTFAEKRNAPIFDNIPQCFGTVNIEKNYIIFLENLKPKNFRLNKLEELMNLNQAKLVLKAYANWHALNLACRDQEPEKFAYFEELMSPTKASSICELFVTSMTAEIEAAIELFRKEGCLEIMNHLLSLKEKYATKFRECFYNKDESHLVVRHADCWNNNFLFHYDDEDAAPDKAVIIDWQISYVGSPLADVALFLFYSCGPETLRQIDDLLKYYYNSLSENLKKLGSYPEKCFPWKTCQESFKKYVLVGVGGVALNIRFRHKTDLDEQTEIQNQSDGLDSFNILCGKEIREPQKYFQTMKDIFELCIEKNYI